MTKQKVLLSVCAVILVFGAVQARQAWTKEPSLTALDYIEIQQLYARYSHGGDSGAGKGAMFAGVFTPDGTLEWEDGTMYAQGAEELTQNARRGARHPTNVSHLFTNVLIEPSPGGATGLAYFVTVRATEVPKPPQVPAARPSAVGHVTPAALGVIGIYQDDFVKTPQGWRIKKRVMIPASSQASAPVGLRSK